MAFLIPWLYGFLISLGKTESGEMTNLICVGSIAGSYGVNGEVRVKSFCADPVAIETYSPLFDESGETQYTLALIGPITQGFNGRIVGVDTKEQADDLKGVKLFTSRDKLPDLPDDEFYYSDLEGMSVFDTGGVAIGSVKTVANHGADDLLEVQLNGSGETAFIPFTQELVPTVDLKAARIVVDPTPGMLPDPS